jgi:hypothetical protein
MRFLVAMANFSNSTPLALLAIQATHAVKTANE